MVYYDEHTNRQQKIHYDGSCGSHGCLIPHGTSHRTNLLGTKNGCSFCLEIEGEIREMPLNVWHYIAPNAHKPYARFMPDYAFAKYCLTQPIRFLTIEEIQRAVEEKKQISNYGFITYVNKKGNLLVGATSPFGGGIYAPTMFKQPDNYAGKIVQTNTHDEEVLEDARVQHPKYYPLCEEISKRLAFQSFVESQIRKFAKYQSQQDIPFDHQKVHSAIEKINTSLDCNTRDFLAQASNLVKSECTDSNETFTVCLSINGISLKDANNPSTLLTNDSIEELSFNVIELIVLQYALIIGYTDTFTFDPETDVITFNEPSREILTLLEEYKNECEAGTYSNPAFDRTSTVKEDEDGYPSDIDEPKILEKVTKQVEAEQAYKKNRIIWKLTREKIQDNCWRVDITYACAGHKKNTPVFFCQSENEAKQLMEDLKKQNKKENPSSFIKYRASTPQELDQELAEEQKRIDEEHRIYDFHHPGVF